MAAAWFNRVAPSGWSATSAGLEPQETVSAHAVRLLAGTPVADLLDETSPRPVSAVSDPALVVTIDCSLDSAPGAVSWRLDNAEFEEPMCSEIRQRAEELATALATGGSTPDR
jgi:hypothetical protein